MNQRKRFPIWLIILIIGIALAAALVVLKPTPKPKPQPAKVPERVSVVPAIASTRALPVYSQGSISPRREIDLTAEVTGRISAVAANYVSGESFSAAQVLVNIDDANYRIALTQAQAQVADATQLLAIERGKGLQAQREWRDLGDQQANELFLRKPQLLAAQAQLQSAQAALAKAQLELDRTQISAPFAGRIRETYANLGQFVTAGSKIARVYDAHLAQVRLPLSDSQLALLDLPLGFRAANNEGPVVTLRATVAGQPRQWLGRISHMEASLDLKTRMYYAVAEIDQRSDANKNNPLVIGLFVEATIEGKPIEEIIQLPRSAIFQRDKIVRIDQNNIAHPLQVKILASTDAGVYVKALLGNGDLVATGRQGYLFEGAEVTPIHAAEIESSIVGETE